VRNKIKAALTIDYTPGGGWRDLIEQTANHLTSTLDQSFWGITAVSIVIFLTCLIVADLQVKIWFDEFFTLYMAKQGSPAAIVKATLHTVDAAPPTYAIIVSFILSVVKLDPLAVRFTFDTRFLWNAALPFGFLSPPDACSFRFYCCPIRLYFLRLLRHRGSLLRSGVILRSRRTSLLAESGGQ
jgi:hypothetical protein